MKELKNLIKLSSQVKIYVPSTINVDGQASEEIVKEKINQTLRFLASIFGGSTASKALGTYVSTNGSLIMEDVTICFSFAREDDLNQNIRKIYDFCLAMRQDMRQEAISLEVNGDLYFV